MFVGSGDWLVDEVYREAGIYILRKGEDGRYGPKPIVSEKTTFFSRNYSFELLTRAWTK